MPDPLLSHCTYFIREHIGFLKLKDTFLYKEARSQATGTTNVDFSNQPRETAWLVATASTGQYQAAQAAVVGGGQLKPSRKPYLSAFHPPSVQQ